MSAAKSKTVKPKAVKPVKVAKPEVVAGKERLMSVLVAPHVSEKSARVSEGANQFVFRVRPDATKPEIKAAIELMFEVKVDGVQVVNAEGKTKRFGQRFGRRQDFKKAYVRLAAGQTIELAGPQA